MITDKLGDASELFVKRAITLTVAREPQPGDDSSADNQSHDSGNDHDGGDFQDQDSAPQYADEEAMADDQ